MSSTTGPTIPFAIFNGFLTRTYGVLLAGMFIGCMLFGILVLQVYVASKLLSSWALVTNLLSLAFSTTREKCKILC